MAKNRYEKNEFQVSDADNGMNSRNQYDSGASDRTAGKAKNKANNKAKNKTSNKAANRASNQANDCRDSY